MVLAEGVLFRPRGLAGGGEGEEGREEDEGARVPARCWGHEGLFSCYRTISRKQRTR